jgi:hypothetical protein
LHFSLQARVTALVVFVVTAIVAGKSALDLYTNSAERETSTVYHLQMVTAMQSKALAGALWDYNVDHVTSIVEVICPCQRDRRQGQDRCPGPSQTRRTGSR